MEEKQNAALGTAPLGKLMVKFALPCTISLLVGALYNIVDQIFIGWGVGYLGNGATNVVFPLTVLALVVLLSGKIEKIGLTGKALYYLVTSYATQTVMLLFVAVGILLAAVLILALLYGFSVKRAVPPPKH